MSKEQQKMLIIALVAIAALYAYIQFLYLPINQKADELNNSLSLKKKDLEDAKINASDYEKLKAESKQKEMELRFTIKRLPKFDDQPGLIKEISKSAGANNISVLSFEFQKIVAGKSFYSEVPIRLSVTCSYHDFGKFITKLGYAMRLIGCSECSFATAGNNIKGSVNISILLKAFISTKEKEGTSSASQLTKEEEEKDFPIIPLYKYTEGNMRDPFKAINISEVQSAAEIISITSLKLTSVIAMAKSEIAVFEDNSKLSYMLIDGKFYTRDKILIKNIEGKIEKNRVLLSQLDTISGGIKEVKFDIR